ncbi:MAG: hypothetical protein E1N59_2026 [Puniceicoccaceae bacterium 5H]|nr:MAG: hypothetical protein E1N59_2026 [Puniceicoccaceae bacterium 5H]
MSSFLAISAVTAILRGVLQDSVGRHDLATVLGGDPEVSALPPDRIEVDEGSPDRINLFLFQATENPAWRNMDMPARNGRGARLGNPKLALDLHYLVTAYGSGDLQAEVLLGHAMFVFHETPIVTRQAVSDQLAALPAGPLADALRSSRLAQQFEPVRIVPRVLSVEEVSKVWTALQSQYRPTAAYQVSVVLIEAEQPTRTALPVVTRGRPVPATGSDEGVFVQANLLPPVPTLEALAFPFGAPAIRMGETLTLSGHHLAGANIRVRFRLSLGTGVLELPATGTPTNTTVTVQLPPDPPAGPVTPDSPLNPVNWRAGVYEVSVVTEQGGVDRESNRLPFLLAPRLDSVDPVPPAGPLATVEVSCSPPIQEGQTVSLLVGSRELAPEPFAAPEANLSFTAPGAPDPLPSGPQWVRLRVDGVLSLVVNYQASPPAFEATQAVTLP